MAGRENNKKRFVILQYGATTNFRIGVGSFDGLGRESN